MTPDVFISKGQPCLILLQEATCSLVPRLSLLWRGTFYDIKDGHDIDMWAWTKSANITQSLLYEHSYMVQKPFATVTTNCKVDCCYVVDFQCQKQYGLNGKKFYGLLRVVRLNLSSLVHST